MVSRLQLKLTSLGDGQRLRNPLTEGQPGKGSAGAELCRQICQACIFSPCIWQILIEAQPCVRGISGQLSPTQLCNSLLFSLIEAHLSHAGGRSADCRGMRGGCGLEPSGLWHACLKASFLHRSHALPSQEQGKAMRGASY